MKKINKIKDILSVSSIIFIFEFISGLLAVFLLMKFSKNIPVNSADFLNPISWGIDKNIFILILSLPFYIGLGYLFVIVKFIYKKQFVSLINPKLKVDFKKIFRSFWLWFILVGFIEFILFIIYPHYYTFNFEPISFAKVIGLSIIILPIQVLFEELIFRSFLWDIIKKYSQINYLPLVLSSIIFGLFHSFNPEIQTFGYILVLYYISVGFVLGYLKQKSNSIELSYGFHLANNFFGFALVSNSLGIFKVDSLVISNGIPLFAILYSLFVSASLIYIYLIRKSFN